MSAPNSFRYFTENHGVSRYWEFLPWIGLLAVFLTLSFFSVIGGWCFAYVLKSATGIFSNLDNETVKQICCRYIGPTAILILFFVTIID